MALTLAKQLWKNIDFQEHQPKIKELCDELGITPILAKIFVARKMVEPQRILQFLEPSETLCNDPYAINDMDIAIERIYEAWLRGEKIVIYGDYDVDGTMATVLLYKYFRKLGLHVHYFIPQRLKTGHGLTQETVENLKKKGTHLVITVDNGSTAVEEAQMLRTMGIDLIITDHHPFGAEIPEALAIVNPQFPETEYPFPHLCGTAVAYKLLLALDLHLEEKGYWTRTNHIRPNLEKDLDLVAFATISDQVPLIGENRYFVKEGLRILNENPRLGFQALIMKSKVQGNITPTVISFKLAPKINAAGRLSDPHAGVRLLLATSLKEANPLARTLIHFNEERQIIEKKALVTAFDEAEKQSNRKAIILIDKNWHPGVMGLIASRVAQKYHKPTVALTLAQGKIAVGSARSFGSFDIRSVLQSCSDVLERFGGHKAAVGLSVLDQNLENFFQLFHELIEKRSSLKSESQSPEELRIDIWVEQKDWKLNFSKELLKMSPFGEENPPPLIGLKKVKPSEITLFGNDHLKFILQTPEENIEVFAWDQVHWYEHLQKECDLVISPQIYSPRNSTLRLQFKAIDIRPTVS